MIKKISAKSLIFGLGILAFLLIAFPEPGKALEPSDYILDSDYAALTGIAYGNNTFVMTGVKENYSQNGTISFTGYILTSSDGEDWTIRKKYPDLRITGVAYKNNTFIVTGWDGTICISPDGIRWTKERCGILNDLTSVTYGKDTFVAVGYHCNVCTSTDGKNWKKQESIIIRSLSLLAFNISDIAYGSNAFVAVGWMGIYPNYGFVLTSLDGITWRLPSINFENLYGVAYGNNQFIVVGDYNTVFSSLDGYNWTGRQITSNEMRFWTIDYENNTFLASGYDPINECSSIFISSDGENWSVASADCSADITAFAYGNNIFVAGRLGYYYTSTDGYSWEIHTSI